MNEQVISTIKLVDEATVRHRKLHKTEPKRVYLGWKRYEEVTYAGLVYSVNVSSSTYKQNDNVYYRNVYMSYFMGMILRLLDDDDKGYGVEVQ